MGNAGIQASQAGTGLRMMLKKLLKPSEEAQKVFDKLNVSIYKVGTDGEKSARNIIDVLQDLQDAGASPLDINEIFGIRASTGAQVVIGQTVGSLKELYRVLKDESAGTALRQQEIQMEGLNGAIKALTSAYGELSIAVGDAGLLDNTTKFTKKITTLIRELAKSDPEKIKLFTEMGAFAAALPVAIWGLGGLTSAIATMMIHPKVVLFATMVAGLVALAALGQKFRLEAAESGRERYTTPELIHKITSGAFGTDPDAPKKYKLSREELLGLPFGSRQGMTYRDYPQGQGSNLPQIIVNNETYFSGMGMDLTTGEAVETIERTVKTGIDEVASKLQRDLPGAK